jgi:hypothetical protein
MLYGDWAASTMGNTVAEPASSSPAPAAPSTPSTSDTPNTLTNQLVMSYLLMRIFVGTIGLLLPWVLLVGNWLCGQAVQPSISNYYYTPMRNVFVGALWALAMFLIAYNGYDWPDRLITNIAGACAIGVSLFPTPPYGPSTAHQQEIGYFHFAFAGVAFVLLGVMSLRFASREPTPPGLPFGRRCMDAFGFTGPGTSSTPAWELIAYRVSGFLIIACAALSYPLWHVNAYTLIYLETILLTAFGASWFIKGRKLLTGG